MKHAAFALVLALAVIPAWLRAPTRAESLVVAAPRPSPTEPRFEAGFIFVTEPTPFTHSPGITELDDGSLLVVWFGGSREGAADVALFQSRWSPTRGQWSKPRVLTDRRRTQSELGRYVNTLGNPALAYARDGRLWLFYVASPGGWSASSVQWKISSDRGESWTAARRMVTSPYANLGTLVRTTPFLFRDGSLGVPSYHELLGVFPELLQVGESGRIVAKRRLDHGLRSLQPAIVGLDAHRALALLRPRPEGDGVAPRLLRTESRDAGASWSPPQALDLENPGSSVAALRLTDGRLLAVFNGSERDRSDLSLAVSDDMGTTWRRARRLEKGSADESFAYPSVIQSRDGTVHIVYAWHYRRIKHVALSPLWLEEEI